MSSLAKLSFLKSLLRRDGITRSILECHDQLDDCLQQFNVCCRSSYLTNLILTSKCQFEALLRLKHFQSENEEARRKDAQALESKINLYASHNQEALRELKIQQRTMADALVAMQRVSLSAVP